MASGIDSPLTVILSAIPNLTLKRVLDVGCGSGGLAGLLAAQGAMVTGIDPNPFAIQQARDLVPMAEFREAGADSIPFRDASFDAVAVVNTLHHVPIAAMRQSLGEMARVLRPDGRLIVIEPLATGSFFEALQLVEDESLVRQAAQRALEDVMNSGLLVREETISYVRRETYADVDGFLARIIAVDHARAHIVSNNLKAITQAVQAAACLDSGGGLVLDQPIKADVLRVIKN